MKGFNSYLTVTTADDGVGGVKPLFGFPVQIVKATGSTDVKLDRAAPSGAKPVQQYIDPVTEKVCEDGDITQGVRTGDSFATIPAEQLQAIDEATKTEDIRVLRSLPESEVDFTRAVGRHFLQAPPKGGSNKHYRITYEALLAQPAKGKAKARPAMALEVKYTSTKRQRLGVVIACPERNCLMLIQMTWAADLKEPDEAVLAPSQAEVEAKQIALARKVIEGLPHALDAEPTDDAIAEKRELVEQAAAGATIEVPATPEVAVIESDEIGAALEASLA